MSDFIFWPFAATIRERTVKELFLQKMITEGVLAINDEHHPRMLERKLKAFLTPSARHGYFTSFENIKEKLELHDLRKST